MAQSFFPITPVDITPSTTMEWTDIDVSGSVPTGTTGIIFHIATTASYQFFGMRKNGSTDDRRSTSDPDINTWGMIGVDGSYICEAYINSADNITIWLVGYTMSGVTFNTNADDMSMTDWDEWKDIDCSSEAPNATGLIFTVQTTNSLRMFGLRKNGSTDDRFFDTLYAQTYGAVIGCDDSQVCEGKIESTYTDFFLIGYITTGVTFNTNATDLSLGSTGSWTDLTALPAGSGMGIIEVTTSDAYDYGLRPNGSAEDIYHNARSHPWAIVACDSLVIEGKIANTAVDFFLVGYAEISVSSLADKSCMNTAKLVAAGVL